VAPVLLLGITSIEQFYTYVHFRKKLMYSNVTVVVDNAAAVVIVENMFRLGHCIPLQLPLHL
jgi:hypothetical protein